MKRLVLLCLCLAALTACKPKPVNINDNGKLGLLADRTCQAISLRQERFALAKQMRFAQDTLTTQKGKGDTARLHNELREFRKQKDSLLKASLDLANIIHHQLDSLMPYTDKAAQKRFSAALDSMLKTKGCLVTNKEDDLAR